MKSYLWIVAVFLAFASGIATGIYSVKKAEPHVVAPLVIDFCSLATNQDFLVGERIQTTAEMSIPLEGGGVLLSHSCPEYMLVFRVSNSDTCWQTINSEYDRNGASADFIVQVEGTVRGRRRLVNWFHKADKQYKDEAHRPPRVTIVIERFLSCTKK
jgi:hypothetical protein